jgi:murein DD-endopeptidase MepM/ murein hydrolase activator NlpD
VVGIDLRLLIKITNGVGCHMEDVYTRARYSRYGGNVKRRRKTNGGGFAAKAARQVFISALILSVLWFIKGIDSPVTAHVINGVKWVAEKSVEPKMMYDSIKNMFKRDPPIDGAEEAKGDGERGKGASSGQGEGAFSGQDKGVSAGRSEGVFAGQGEDKLAGQREGSHSEPGESMPSGQDEGSPSGSVLSASVEKYGSPTFIYPLDGYVAVPFGERENYLTKAVEFHCGVDIATREKAEVLAALGGCVIETGNKDTYGLYLKIDHGNGWQTVYGHCSEILVRAGDKVEQGDIVAGVKFAGTAESHLHFEIWKDEMPVDPLLYLGQESF